MIAGAVVVVVVVVVVGVFFGGGSFSKHVQFCCRTNIRVSYPQRPPSSFDLDI